MRSSTRVVATGLALGAAGALAAGRLLEGLLFSVRPADPLTFAVAAGLLVAVTGVSTYIPARRATRLDPVRALRSE